MFIRDEYIRVCELNLEDVFTLIRKTSNSTSIKVQINKIRHTKEQTSKISDVIKIQTSNWSRLNYVPIQQRSEGIMFD